MIKLTDRGIFLDKTFSVMDETAGKETAASGKTRTMAYQILKAHNQSGDMENLKLKFDALVSPDNNYVSILQDRKSVV